MNDAVSWVLWNFLYFGKKIEATDFLMYNLKNKHSIIIDGLMQSLYHPWDQWHKMFFIVGKGYFYRKKYSISLQNEIFCCTYFQEWNKTTYFM